MPTSSTANKSRTVRLLVSGLGNIGRRFLQVLIDKDDLLRARYGLEFRVVGAADSRGAASDPAGLNLAEIVRLKEAGKSIAAYPGAEAGRTPLTLIEQLDADALCESTPVNLQDGEPGHELHARRDAQGHARRHPQQGAAGPGLPRADRPGPRSRASNCATAARWPAGCRRSTWAGATWPGQPSTSWRRCPT